MAWHIFYKHFSSCACLEQQLSLLVFFFKSYGPNKVQFFFLGINSRGIFQVNFDLCIVQCQWQLRAIKFLEYFSPNFLFSSTLSCHRQTYFNHTEWNVKKDEYSPQYNQSWLVCIYSSCNVEKNKMLFFLSNFISSWKSIFVGAKKKNLNQSNHIFVVERKHFVIFVNDQSDLVLQVLGILFDQSDLVLCLYLLLSLVILHTIVIVSSNITGSVRW